MDKPKVVCLCGSTRFYDAFESANYEETMGGKIVLSVGFYNHSLDRMHGEYVGCTPEQKIMLDELHKRKIDICNEVLVLNVGGYIGESTRSEIEYAEKIGRSVGYLENKDSEVEDVSRINPTTAKELITAAVEANHSPNQFNSVVMGILEGVQKYYGEPTLELRFNRNLRLDCYDMLVSHNKQVIFSVGLGHYVLDIQRTGVR